METGSAEEQPVRDRLFAFIHKGLESVIRPVFFMVKVSCLNYLAEKGFKVMDMEGGILAWKEHNLPIVSGP